MVTCAYDKKKALVIQFKTFKNKLVSGFQMAGMEGRLIQVNVLVANELLDTRLKSRTPGV